MRRTLFLSEHLMFRKLDQGRPVVEPHEKHSGREAVIMQCINPLSTAVSTLVKDHQVDLCVVEYGCSKPVQFLNDLAEAGLSTAQVVLITCPCSGRSTSRIIIPDAYINCLKLLGQCEDQEGSAMRQIFEHWLSKGFIDFQKVSLTG